MTDGPDIEPTNSWQTSRSGAVYRFLLLVAYLVSVPTMVLGPMVLAFALSDRTHEFGPWDPRYLLLVSGSVVERLDLVEPISGSVSYAARGQEGTAPGHIHIGFHTAALPERIMKIYEVRCAALGLVPQRMPHDGNEHKLRCNGEKSELGIGASRPDHATLVTIGGWEF